MAECYGYEYCVKLADGVKGVKQYIGMASTDVGTDDDYTLDPSENEIQYVVDEEHLE